MSMCEEWFLRAKSKMFLAKLAKSDINIHYCDTMYCIQQAVEVLLKTAIAHFDDTQLPPKTHDISVLCKEVEKYVKIPDNILLEIIPLTQYVTMRYPHEFEIGTQADCEDAYAIAIQLFQWIDEEVINNFNQ